MEALRLTLPWPPSVNHYWRTVPMRGRGGRGTQGFRVVISREGRVYRREVIARLGGLNTKPLASRLHVRVVLHPPTRRKLDIDNRMKALLDALEHAGVYLDDGQIDRIEIERGGVVKGGAAIVEIEAVKPSPMENIT